MAARQFEGADTRERKHTPDVRHGLEVGRQLREVTQERRIRYGRCIEQEDRPFPVSESGVVALVIGEIGIVLCSSFVAWIGPMSRTFSRLV